jgi:hypothetical protein
MTEVQFLDDEKTQDAVIPNFEISARLAGTLIHIIPILHNSTPRCLGDLPTKCAMHWRMAISR